MASLLMETQLLSADFQYASTIYEERILSSVIDNLFSSKIFHNLILGNFRCALGDGFSIFLNGNGIIYTCGYGGKGCLGHGDWNNLVRPTIISKQFD